MRTSSLSTVPPASNHAERVTVRPARNGLGLFATRRYARGEPIIVIRGRIVHWQLLWDRGGRFADNCLRFGPETYLDPSDDVGRYVNHGCEPNAGIGKALNRLYLFAANPIRKGSELLIDYSTTIGDDDIWTMRCNCGHAACRGKIARFGLLPPATRERYRREGLVPAFIIRTLE